MPGAPPWVAAARRPPWRGTASASYEVLDRNWRCAEGELDLVAASADGDVLVFCEVKTRSSACLRLSLRGRHPGQATPRAQAWPGCGCAAPAAAARATRPSGSTWPR